MRNKKSQVKMEKEGINDLQMGTWLWREEGYGSIKLENNEFFLILQRLGCVFKTRSEEEFDKICSWEQADDLIIKEIVKNSRYLFFLTGKVVHRKKIALIKVAQPFEKNYYFDISEIDLKGGKNIRKAWIGRKDETEQIESLIDTDTNQT